MKHLTMLQPARDAVKHIALRLAVLAAVLLGTGLHTRAQALSYDFNDGTLQGWNNRVWNGSAWIDLAANVTTYGSLLPTSTYNSIYGAGGGSVWPNGGNTDGHLNTLWLRSPLFYLTATGDLTVSMAKGQAYGPAPANDAAVSYIAQNSASGSTGWKGVALRRVSDGVFVLAKPRTTSGDNWVTVTFTQAELAPYVGIACTLDVINSEKGGWGWLTMDNVSIPGDTTPPAQGKDITGFTFPTFGAATISGSNISLTVPYGNSVTAMAPTYTLSAGATCLPASGSTQNFSSPVHYVVTATDLSTKDYTVTVTVAPISLAKDILTFGPGATITGNAIAWTVPYNTSVTALAPSFTLSPLATASPPSGSSRNFSTPQTYTVTAQDNTTQVYTVTVTVAAQGPGGVVSGLALWLDAAQLSSLNNGDQVNTWSDMSGNSNSAIRQSGSSAGYPKYVTGQINGQPVVRFNSSSSNPGDFLKFTRISTIRSVFWVVKENAGTSDGHFLLGDDSSYDFHRGEAASHTLWDGDNGWSSANIRNGVTKLMGTAVNGTTTSLPSAQAQLISLVTTGNVQANQLTQDRIYHGSWQGDIAEILIYTRALSDTEEAAVGSYLASKYGLVTAYAPQAQLLTFGSPEMSPAVIDHSAKTIAVTVPFGTLVSNLAPTYTLSSGATCNKASGSTQNFSSPLPYTVTSSDGLITNIYTVTVSVAPKSSAKDILSCSSGAFGAPEIAANSITFTVPAGTNVTNLAATFTLSPLATISPASGSYHDFTNPMTYTVTAQDGSTKVYSVIMQSYAAWTYNASLFILTTPEGANLPASTSETNFPLLVRLNSGNFDFSQPQADGRDLRFSSATGAVLSYQIEQWDAAAASAAIWVKIPIITGNARQEIKMYWGKAGASSESNAAAVFNTANGYVSVFHMNETMSDAVGTLTPTLANGGPLLATGIIGKGRFFTAGQGVNCGDNLTSLPTGNTTHSTQAWFRSSSSNFEIVDWAREDAGNKVQIRLLTPPKIYIDGNFASITGNTTLSTSQWHQVVHTYSPGVSRIYIDGQLDASANVNMTMTPPSIMRLGGWYGTYNFVGDMDEVRLSKVTRSAGWIKLEYENQKTLQTLVGNPVQPGSSFSATPASLPLNEGGTGTLSAQAGGAQMVYWIEKKNGVDTVLATDQFTLPVSAGRGTGDQSYVIEFKAIYASEIKTVDIPVAITEYLPDPVFTLTGPATWDGRQTITITPAISNLAALQTKNVANLNYSWVVNGVAVTKQITPGTASVPGYLTLTRAQGNGPLSVTLVLDNGGTLVSSSKTITVEQPASDAWEQRTPGSTEKPVSGQFYARDDSGYGKIYYNGSQSGTPDTVFLKVYTTDIGSDVLYSTLRQSLVGGKYAFTAPITPGKVTYKVVYGTTTGGTDTIVDNTITNLICGDAYIIEGQSNAEATAPGTDTTGYSSPWIRTYNGGWGNAVRQGTNWIGYWGMDLAIQLLTDYNMPICIINGAVGGTRIDQHQPNPADHSQAGSLYSIYATLYNRVVAAKLTHGVRAVLWHQGEQDQGSGGPDGDYDYKFYQQYFVDMTAAWKQDYPNLQKYYVFQIWPAACGDVSRNDLLREAQRTLPNLFSNLRMMTTVGIVPGSSCHYEPAGYQRFSDLMSPMVEQDFYGYMPGTVITAPNLNKAYFTTTARNEITLEFDQNMAWNTGVPNLIFLDGAAGKVASGSVSGKLIKLTLSAASTASTITYLQGTTAWAQGNLLYGTNGIAALTFAEVPIALATSNAFSAWIGSNYPTLTGTMAQPGSDPDGDGMSNQAEFAFGLDPSSSASCDPIKVPFDGASGTFSYTRRATPTSTGLVYTVWTSTDLKTWTQDSAASAGQTVSATNGDVQTVAVHVTPAPSSGKLFVRVQAQ